MQTQITGWSTALMTSLADLVAKTGAQTDSSDYAGQEIQAGTVAQPQPSQTPPSYGGRGAPL